MINKLTKALLASQGIGYGSSSISREVAAVKKFVQGGVFLDVGANKGLYSRELLSAYGKNLVALHCFEPSSELVNAHLNFDDRRVAVHPVALGAENAEAALHKVHGNPGLNSLTKRRLEHFNIEMTEQEAVRVVSLDDYCTEHQIGSIDCLKIDVEGHELDVLKGSVKHLDRNAIKCIQFEFGGCNIDTRTYFQDFWYLLAENYGYSIYRITPFGIKRIAKYSELDEIFLTTNYIAAK